MTIQLGRGKYRGYGACPSVEISLPALTLPPTLDLCHLHARRVKNERSGGYIKQ